MSRGDDVPPDGAEILDAGPGPGVGAASRLLAPPAEVAAAPGRGRGGSGGRDCWCSLRRPPGGFPRGTCGARPAANGRARPSPAASSGVVPASAAPATVLGHPFVGVHAGWELFGRGPGVVVRIQFAGGRVTRTAYPALLSGGPVTFVTDAEGALVRPIDLVPGYLIPDAKPAREAPGAVGAGGRVPRPRPAAPVGTGRRQRRPDGAGRDGRAPRGPVDRRTAPGLARQHLAPRRSLTRPGTCSSRAPGALMTQRRPAAPAGSRPERCSRPGPPAG